MKKYLPILLLLYSLSMFSQQTMTDTITSQKLNEDRVITVSLPPSYDKNPGQRFPLLVLLDGDFLLDPFQGALGYGYYWDDLPEVVIVAIHQNKNNERETDTTVDEATGLPSEKGEKFFEFLGMELLPSIQKQYRIAPFKIIAGLDVTAAFLNFYLYKDNPVFNAYISMSPELPLDMETYLPERLKAIPQPIYYYQSSADGDVKAMRDRILAMDTEIKKITNPTLNYKFDDFIGASHYSLVLHSIPNALYQIFSVYQPISTTEFQEKIAKLPSGYVEYLRNKYDILEKTLNLKLQIRLNDFKAIEAAILKNKAYAEFDQLAQLARKNYPRTMLADYHLALMYEKNGDTKKAAKAYQSAFQLDEIGDLTTDYMIEKMDQMKNAPAKTEPLVEEVPPTDVPAETTPAETPSTETPKEDKKTE
jgi:uncharacterized protein